MKLKGEIHLSTDHKKPHVGQTVLFHPRPGELGYVAGTPTVPAIVIDVLGNDNLKLAVVAGDSLVLRLSAPRKTEQDPLGSWEFTAEHHHSSGDELKHLQGQINAVESRLDLLEQLQADIRDLQAQLAELTARHGKGRK